jgi:ABC-type antimicrobial peptide transport system permease subunit
MLKRISQTIIWTLRRNRSYGVLNMAGLAVGIACAILIFLWVEDELTYNHEFKNRDLLYRVMLTRTEADITRVQARSAPVLAEVIQGEIPEVVNVARLTSPQTVSISPENDDSQSFETGYYCDPAFLTMFSVQFVNGNATNAFRDVSSIVLTEEAAGKFFPGENPVGKILQIDGKEVCTVSGVVKKFPDNVSFRFDWLMPYQAYQNPWAQYGWTAYSVETIVELHPSTNLQLVNEKLGDMLTSHGSWWNQGFMFNMNDWHLYSDFDDQGLPVGGKIKLIRLFVFIACIIIVLACINFMNLATAGAMRRAKEVGVLKSIGVRRNMLIRRFLGESMAMAFISIGLGILLVMSIMPFFNQWISKDISFNIFTPVHGIALVVILLFCGLFSGTYPAFFLSSFKAVDVLKGLKLPSHKGTDGMRKSLVVFQFSVSICLIICILVMYGQFLHTRHRDLGYRPENVVTVPMNNAMLEQSMSILHEVRSMPAVENAGIAQDILNHYYWDKDLQWQGKNDESDLPVYLTWCISSVLPAMGIELEAGRDFGEYVESERGNIVINQKLAQEMGEEGRIGGEIRLWNQNYRVIGIAKNHIFNGYHALYSEPLLMFCERSQRPHNLYIKIKSGNNISSILPPVEALLKPYIANRPFEYVVEEERMNRMMRDEMFVANLLTGFSVIAVLISCFGLLGLIAFAAEQRTREIGIRKVFGATVAQIVLLLSRDFLKLVGIACVIAFPVAWWVMNQWLDNYEYRIGLYWWIFALAGAMAVFIAWCAVGVQAFKAAMANPVKAIKAE